jgi:predicted nucleic acid-binding protein
MSVIDASSMIDLLLDIAPAADEIRRHLLSDGSFSAPALLDAEVGQVLRRYVLRNEISQGRAEAALTDFLDLAIHRYPHAVLMRRAFELRHNLTFYDALYVALAQALDEPLLTGDRALETLCEPGFRVIVV